MRRKIAMGIQHGMCEDIAICDDKRRQKVTHYKIARAVPLQNRSFADETVIDRIGLIRLDFSLTMSFEFVSVPRSAYKFDTRSG